LLGEVTVLGFVMKDVSPVKPIDGAQIIYDIE
jgi:hypothetical protein